MKRLMRLFSVFVLIPGVLAIAQQAQETPKDVLLPPQNAALTWVVGIGVLVLTLIAGFKHPGRTHLD